jgi:sigma-54 dependent transcriptional regulator, acetoin dehydrogenase operon transcriptional activator AcoR
LASRAEDIPELARHFLRQTADGACDPRIDSAALRLLMALPWPGNVRELKLVIETAGAFSHGVVDLAAVENALAYRPAGVELVVDEKANGRRELIVALHDAAWDVDRTAETLGLHRTTLYRRMKQHGIEAPRFAFARTL